MTFTGINPDYAIQSDRKKQIYPALQVTQYRPQTLDETIDFCLSEESLDLIDAESCGLKIEIVDCVYGREKVFMHKITSPLRWILLTIPRVYCLDKETKEVSTMTKGIKLAGSSKVTVAKCLMACLCNGKLVLDTYGSPQIFTLKLTSKKTALIGSLKQEDKGRKTFTDLNLALQKHYKTKCDLVHLVSVNLVAKSHEFISGDLREKSSLGVFYSLEGDAKVLPVEQQEAIYGLITEKETQALFKDPFGLNRAEEEEIDF